LSNLEAKEVKQMESERKKKKTELITKRVFNVLFISVFTAMLGLGIVSPLMPIYAESLGATGIWLGVIFAGFSISRGIFMPIIGRISDRKGRKRFILSGLLIYTIVSVAYVHAGSVYTLTFIRIIHGFASAMVIPIAMAYVGEISPEGEEGKYMGTFTVSLFLGMGFGLLLVVSWRMPLEWQRLSTLWQVFQPYLF